MRKIEVKEVETHFRALLGEVEGGEEIVITRHGQPVARLSRQEGAPDREKARRAAADILAASVGITLGNTSIKELIEEGRP